MELAKAARNQAPTHGLRVAWLGMIVASVSALTENIYFKKGSGGGGYCGDLDDGPGGLHTPTWWYDWGHTAEGFAQCNGTSPVHAEYVPMIWGKWALANSTNLIEVLREKAPHAQYVFGFNEPDHSGSYLKPQDAAGRWGSMETVADTLNLTLISPCVSNYASGAWWLTTFRSSFKNITGREPRMDHMCLHQYTYSSVDLNDTINTMYRAYQRPIWINEFACPPYQNCTASHQLQFMKSALPVLEQSPYVLYVLVLVRSGHWRRLCAFEFTHPTATVLVDTPGL
eukprot:m.280991 g.280991  ORF g.280991 m.280991 type:complete len:284 (+) comp16171_c0_seq2:2950-3801(+)